MIHTDNNRIIFINQLRGLAAISVVCAHFLNNFWYKHEATSSVIFVEPIANLSPPLVSILFSKIPLVLFGEFGVAIFFLISGFVIPLSLEKREARSFLIGRFFRIWPTYLAGLMISVLSLYLISRLQGKPFPFEIHQVLVQSAIILRDWLWYPNIDGIVWTLEIEVKFYLLMAAYISIFRIFSYQKLLIIAGFACLFLLVVAQFKSPLFYNAKPAFYALSVITLNVAIVTFMLCGTMTYLLFRGKIGQLKYAFAITFLMIMFAGCWQYGLYASGRYAIPQYFLALAVFLTCYFLRSRFKANLVIDFLAAISYPLYVLHALFGYSMLYLLIQSGWNATIALLITFCVTIFIAAMVHKFVEMPSHLIGRKFANAAN